MILAASRPSGVALELFGVAANQRRGRDRP